MIFCTDDGEENNHLEETSSKDCNEECFMQLLANISTVAVEKNEDDGGNKMAEHESKCRMLHDFSGSFMYAQLCRNILADQSDDNKKRKTVC